MSPFAFLKNEAKFESYETALRKRASKRDESKKLDSTLLTMNFAAVTGNLLAFTHPIVSNNSCNA